MAILSGILSGSITCSVRALLPPPNMFEPMFLSTAHTSEDIATALERMEEGARQCLKR